MLELLIILLILIIIFPFYVLATLAHLGNEVRQLRARVDGLYGTHGTDVIHETHAASRSHEAVPIEVARQLHEPAAPTAPWRMRPLDQSAEPVAPVQPHRTYGTDRTYATADARVEVASAESSAFDLEKLIGANWLAKLGIAAIAVGVAFFLQYAFRNGWIGPVGQVCTGLAVAAAMTALGQFLLPKPTYRAYAQVLFSGGIIVYFLSIYAAYGFYQPRLLGYAPAFAALAVGGLAASALAMKNNTQVVAVLCVLGAFAAPVLIRESSGPTSSGGLIQLYAYIALINLWVVGLIKLRGWHSLAVVSFASTWLLFFGSGQLDGKGWLTEGFAGLFLLGSLYSGLQMLRVGNGSAAAEMGLGPNEVRNVGLGLVIGGCIAFAFASASALEGLAYFGLPDVLIAGSLCTIVLACVAVFAPNFGDRDADVRKAIGVLSAAFLGGMTMVASGSAKPSVVEDVPTAFAFCLFNYLLFIVVGLIMARREEGRVPAALLIGTNALVHAEMTFTVLKATTVLHAPAFVLWLPVEGMIALAAAAYTAIRTKDSVLVAGTLAGVALLLPLAAAGVGHGLVSWKIVGVWPYLAEYAAFSAEYLALSIAFLSLRKRFAWPQLRIDLIAPVALGTAFFILAWRCLGLEPQDGLVWLAVVAVGMAVFNAACGLAITGRGEDPLLRLIYFGAAAAFIAIAIPLQLDASFITLGWAVEAAALVWAGVARSDARVRRAGIFLLALAGCKALIIDITEKPDLFVFLANERMLAGASVIAAAYLTAWLLLSKKGLLAEDEKPLPNVLLGCANLLTLLFVSWDLWDFVGTKATGVGPVSAGQLALSLFWTLYALTLVSLGIWRRTRAVRLFGMGLMYLSIFKVFLLDLSGLEQPYKIIAFIALGVILLFVSLLYTRFEGRMREDGFDSGQCLS